jgi:hypothetical protein
MRTVTKYVVIGVIAVILIYDVFAIHFGGVESSVSQIVIEWSYAVPAFTFSIGFIMGHLFWRLRDNSKTSKLGKDQE